MYVVDNTAILQLSSVLTAMWALKMTECHTISSIDLYLRKFIVVSTVYAFEYNLVTIFQRYTTSLTKRCRYSFIVLKEILLNTVKPV